MQTTITTDRGLAIRDKKLIWHPFTQEKTAADPIVIERAAGSYLYAQDGRKYLDLISSWWVNLHGHGQPDIARSIYEQALQLDHIVFAGFTHEPAVELCEQLSKCLPPALSRFFFSDNGSTAVEVALKMAYQYWSNQGQPERSIYLSFEGNYHGDTFGAMTVGRSGFHSEFKSLSCFQVLAVPFPATWQNDSSASLKEKETQALAVLDQHLAEFGDKIAAIIIEPLVQGASGMRMCRPEFMRAVIQRVRSRGVLVIFDEIMTGFGRTGTTFALEQIGTDHDALPDFVCLSKGITGGLLPLALTVTTEKVRSAFLHDEWKYAFVHGHSDTANPIACRAAVTSLQLLLNEQTQQAIRTINHAHVAGLVKLQTRCPTSVANTRVLGTISAFEVQVDGKWKRSQGHLNQQLNTAFMQRGLLLRPLGNAIYLLPPYSTTAEELMEAYETIGEVISEL